MIYRSYFKRLIDIIISGLLLMIISPLLVIVTIGLKFYNGNSGVFFLQKRPGKNEKIFNLIKFKTMNDKKNESGELLPSMLRITPLGAFVRKYSLDELPQLFNVLKGDMSLIGPRPLLVQYLSLYTPTQKRRHELRPGITGWAQVNGRNAISWNKKFELDIYYLENLSFTLDIFILWKTFLKVVKGSDVNSKSNLVVETFNGNN
jgi:undecaprenyl phosphate N,N'-diacetylbacillosamine 1-phosphate transferase